MAGKIALQLYTVRDLITNRSGLERALEKIKAIGYDGVQFSGVGAVEGEKPDTSPAEARKLLDANGLKCMGAHRRWSALMNETDAEIEYLTTLGCDFVAVPAFGDEYDRFDPAAYVRFLDDAAPVGERLRSAGIDLGYHNHAHEFVHPSIGADSPFDVLVERGGKDLLMEIDVYWVAFAGANPAAVIRRVKGRIPFIHMKDMEMIREEGSSSAKPVYAPVGEGNLDWDSIIPAAQTAGTRVWIVEQDLCRRDHFDCARSSHDFLRARV